MRLKRGRMIGCVCLFAVLNMGLVETITYESGERRDPFLALISADGTMNLDSGGPKGDFSIEGIIHDPNGASLVLIGGEFYKEGEVIMESTVTNIFKNKVVLEREGETLTLWLRDEIGEGE